MTAHDSPFGGDRLGGIVVVIGVHVCGLGLDARGDGGQHRLQAGRRRVGRRLEQPLRALPTLQQCGLRISCLQLGCCCGAALVAALSSRSAPSPRCRSAARRCSVKTQGVLAAPAPPVHSQGCVSLVSQQQQPSERRRVVSLLAGCHEVSHDKPLMQNGCTSAL